MGIWCGSEKEIILLFELGIDFPFLMVGLSKGSVTPFGVLNDTEHKVQVLLDAFFADGKIGVHPNDNTATVWLQTKDLFLLLQQYGVAISFMEFI